MVYSQTIHALAFQAMASRWFGPSNYTGAGFDFLRDPVTGQPVNYKTQQNGTSSLAMASCAHFVAALQPDQPSFVLAVLNYEQEADLKRAVSLETFTINPADHGPTLLDGLTLETVLEIEQHIRDYNRFPKFEGKAASAYVKQARTPYRFLRIEPKISHSGGPQRRLQCSLPIRLLRNASFGWTESNDVFRGIPLMTIVSLPRTKSSKKLNRNINAKSGSVLHYT